MPFGKLSFKAKAGNQTTQKRNNGRKWLHNLRCRNQLRRVLLATTTATATTTPTTTTLTPVVRSVSQPTTSNNFQRRFFRLKTNFLTGCWMKQIRALSLFLSLHLFQRHSLGILTHSCTHTSSLSLSPHTNTLVCSFYLSTSYTQLLTLSMSLSLTNAVYPSH